MLQTNFRDRAAESLAPWVNQKSWDLNSNALISKSMPINQDLLLEMTGQSLNYRETEKSKMILNFSNRCCFSPCVGPSLLEVNCPGSSALPGGEAHWSRGAHHQSFLLPWSRGTRCPPVRQNPLVIWGKETALKWVCPGNPIDSHSFINGSGIYNLPKLTTQIYRLNYWVTEIC